LKGKRTYLLQRNIKKMLNLFLKKIKRGVICLGFSKHIRDIEFKFYKRRRKFIRYKILKLKMALYYQKLTYFMGYRGVSVKHCYWY